MTKKIELLSPAKDIECARQAILHGADAVYIGSPKYGARAAAGNAFDDLEELVKFAHIYNVKIYCTVNVIIFDEELDDVEKLIWKLYEIGIDALIIQDFGILKMNLPPIALHASTQMNIKTPEKVEFLSNLGFEQVVLARELSYDEIKEIHKKCPNTKLEYFVHGALCVSYSGRCYLSQYMTERSANRGECSQACRMKYDLVDEDLNVLVKDKYLLSLKDNCQIENLNKLIDAGVSSFKIEGRLKGVSYVKNVTSSYSKKINSIISDRKDLERSSQGECFYEFTPNLEKSFNRGRTDYYVNGRTQKIASFYTPKSIGEYLGEIKRVVGDAIILDSTSDVVAGDGLVAISEDSENVGFSVFKLDGDKIYPYKKHDLTLSFKEGCKVYRTHDTAFDKIIKRKTSDRKIKVSISCKEIENGFEVTMFDKGGENIVSVSKLLEIKKEEAKKTQNFRVVEALSKLGNTPFECEECNLYWSKDWFVPISVWTKVRQDLVSELLEKKENNLRVNKFFLKDFKSDFYEGHVDIYENVSNKKAIEFYKEHGAKDIDLAYELDPKEDINLMTTKYCIKYEMGLCPKYNKSDFNKKLFLKRDDLVFSLLFDCKNCVMKIKKSGIILK